MNRMIDELEALVGYVYIVGGRAVNATPPGCLVETPPKRAQRGREHDTFFTLVTPAGTLQGQASFYEQLARLAADLYFKTSGSVTSGLREAIGVVNNNLLEHNIVAGQRYEANMICLVLRGHEVYLARAGGCLSLLRQGDSFVTLPDDLRDEYALNGLPLGYSPVPDIKLSHYEIAPGQVMVLGDVGFAQAERDQLQDALGMGNIQNVIEYMKPLGGGKAQALVIEFISANSPDPVATAPGNTAITRASNAPAAVPAEPLSATGKTVIPATPEAAEAEKQPKKTSEPRTQRPKQEAPKRETGAAPKVFRAADVPAPEVVEAGEASPPEEEPTVEPARRVSETGRKAVGGVAAGIGGFFRGLNRALDRLLPEPDIEGPRVPAMVAVSLAILIPLVIVITVIILQLIRVDYTEFEQKVAEVQTAVEQASTIPLSNTDQAKTAWLGVLQRIEQVETTYQRTSDQLNRFRSMAQTVLDTFAKVTRRTVTPLRTFGEGAKLTGLVIQGGTTLYTLDVKANAIYRDTLSPNGNSIAARSAQPIVQQGQATGPFSVRTLLDITWMPEGGIPRANVLAALDGQGVLVTYSPTFAPATGQSLPGSDLWSNPVAMFSWQGRLYILDPGANQIWRYLPGGTSYPNTPEPYFPENLRPNLKDAVDFAIDTTGNVFVLFSNGTLKRYNAGTEQPFAFNGLPDGALRAANELYLDADAQAIYIADPVDQSVYQVTLAGTFRARFRATDPNAFRQLSGVAADGDRVYVLSGNVLYFFTTSDAAKPNP